MTAYKREGIPAFKGGHNQRLATSSKRKAAMAAFDEALATSRKVFTRPVYGHEPSAGPWHRFQLRLVVLMGTVERDWRSN